MRVAFYTLGCKLNQSESEALASSFKSRGFFVRRHDEDAEIFIVNTCTVTSKAEQKARRIIRHLARSNPESVIIVTGCYAQLNAADIRELAPNVLTLGHDRKYQLLELADCLKATGKVLTEDDHPPLRTVNETVRSCLDTLTDTPADTHGIFRFDPETYSFHSRAFLKIQDGCDHQCAYCRVRLARGASVSLSPDQVLERAAHLADRGYREIVLTGVNLTAYRDPADRFFGLPRLLELLTSVPGEYRIRLTSLEPEMISDKLLQAVSHPRICPHFHIPVQSGSDRILKAVYRPYTADKIRRAVAGLRKVKKDPFLAADVIAGLPGEAEEDFEASRSLIEELGFAALHVFPFSPRPGTELYHAKQHVPERIAGERAALLRELALRLHDEYAQRWIGTEVTVLPEEIREIKGEKYWSGLSENYLRVELPFEQVSRWVSEFSGSGVNAAGDQTGVRGSLLPVRIRKVEDERVFGEIAELE